MKTYPSKPAGLVYVAAPSVGILIEKRLTPQFLRVNAALRLESPDAEFVSPSLQNYMILPYMDGHGADYQTWRARCEMLMSRCDAMIILPFVGWKQSQGVIEERLFANERDMPIYMDRPRPEYVEHPGSPGLMTLPGFKVLI